MPQSLINDFFTVATPEQIAQQNQLAWAKLHNCKQAMVALQKVTAEQNAVCAIEKQHSDSASRSRKYRARLKAAKKPTMKQKPQLRPPLSSSDLLLPSRNPMQIPLKKASKKQIDTGTAPPRVRAPPQHWLNPNLWPDIAQAAVLSAWSPQGIIKHLTRTPAGAFRFKGLNRGTVWKMMDRNKHGAWSATTISAVESQRKCKESSKTLGCPRLLAKHPEITNIFEVQIRTMCENGVPLSIPIIRGVLLGVVLQLRPELLADEKYKISRSFIICYMHSLNYSYHVATKSAKSTPQNWHQLGHNMAIRIASSIKTHQNPPELVINAELGNPKGDKQVLVTGKDEKRQVTLMMASTASGSLLMSQVIVPGKTAQSLPPETKTQPFAEDLKYVVSGGNKHWSNLGMMKAWVMDILVPYIHKTKKRLGLSSRVRAVLLLDCWSVHRSKDFLACMRQEYGKLIRIHFVPASCTGKLQPNDQLLNRCLKHEINTMAVEWMASAVKDSLALNEHVVSFPTDLPTLRAISVAWFGKSLQKLSARSELIKKAWASVAADDWNLSYDFLVGTQMDDLINEAYADKDWIHDNAHERGINMAPELMDLHEEQDYDDDTALNMTELREALEGIGDGIVDEEGNVMVRSASETQVATNVSNESYDRDSDIEDIDMIDVDAISDSVFSA